MRGSWALVCAVAAVAILARAFRQITSRTARRQLRWIAWGTALGVGPFALGYALPWALGSDPPLALQLTAQMIVTQPSVKVCHVVLGGFDTHQQEDTRQTALLAYADAAVSAFMQDLEAHGQADRVVLMTWSEFGRRVAENGSRGTDHGSAAPVFVVGKPVAGGLYGEATSSTRRTSAASTRR